MVKYYFIINHDKKLRRIDKSNSFNVNILEVLKKHYNTEDIVIKDIIVEN